MIRRPPRSTLFPYNDALPISVAIGIGDVAGWAERSCDPGKKCPPLRLDTDRKSTRLNSSHSSISYAVFCLKKKKKDSQTFHIESLIATLKIAGHDISVLSPLR